MFLDGPGYDLHLSPGSPAIEHGKPQTEPATDFYGNAFSGPAPSIGAVEVTGNTETKEAVASRYPAHIRLYPNPARDHLEVSCEGYEGLFEIWSLTGLKLLAFESGRGISIARLNPGIYFLKAGNLIVPFIKD